MMTVSETARAQKAAQKGRSASFSVAGPLSRALPAAHSSSDLLEGEPCVSQKTPMQKEVPSNGTPPPGGSGPQQSTGTPSRLRSGSAARRSQSCRLEGSRPPRVGRRLETPSGSGAGLDQEFDHSGLLLEVQAEGTGVQPYENGSYNSFLKKVGSCGRLITLGPEDEVEPSPILRRSASARRPPPATSPTHSPTLTRSARHVAASSIKGRPPSRRGATPGSTSAKRAPPSTGGFLDVRGSGSSEALNPEAYLLRNFQTTNKGIVNRGDSFRRRRSRSNSIQPHLESAPLPSVPPLMGDIASVPVSPELSDGKEAPSEHFRVVVVGAAGVGKTALMNQFRTSECINAYDCSGGADEKEEQVSIELNNIESEIVFVNVTTAHELQEEMQKVTAPSGWLLVYSVTDKASFQRATEDLGKLQAASLLKGRVIILAGNKCELVRSRTISYDDGRDLAISYGAKFMEISVGMNHKCDDLLVGILHQLRLKEEATPSHDNTDEKGRTPWTRNRSLMRASMKAKRLVNRIMGRSDSKYKQCEDFLN